VFHILIGGLGALFGGTAKPTKAPPRGDGTTPSDTCMQSHGFMHASDWKQIKNCTLFHQWCSLETWSRTWTRL